MARVIRPKIDIEGALKEARWRLRTGSWALRSDDEIMEALTVNPQRRAAIHRLRRLRRDDIIPRDERAIILRALRAYKLPRKQGGQKLEISDRLLVETIAAMQRFGFFPTRNRATGTRECGASIVARVLKEFKIPFAPRERQLAKIWADHRRRLRSSD